MTKTPGTSGYVHSLQKFIHATHSIEFSELHKDFLPFLPPKKSLILDLGAGIGRDSYEFSKMGHSVVAVEPLGEFLNAGRELYGSTSIHWIQDSLPLLIHLSKYPYTFDFVLSSGVWHHLSEADQSRAVSRVAELLKPKGRFALSLRNGPPGAGSYVFPTDVNRIIEQGVACGLVVTLELREQPSL
ncbi:MAG: methyltransferase domain-containing protein, partial [Bacteroidota bacterium]